MSSATTTGRRSRIFTLRTNTDVGAGVKKDSGFYTFQRTIARADFMLASLPSITVFDG